MHSSRRALSGIGSFFRASSSKSRAKHHYASVFQNHRAAACQCRLLGKTCSVCTDLIASIQLQQSQLLHNERSAKHLSATSADLKAALCLRPAEGSRQSSRGLRCSLPFRDKVRRSKRPQEHRCSKRSKHAWSREEPSELSNLPRCWQLLDRGGAKGPLSQRLASFQSTTGTRGQGE